MLTKIQLTKADQSDRFQRDHFNEANGSIQFNQFNQFSTQLE